MDDNSGRGSSRQQPVHVVHFGNMAKWHAAAKRIEAGQPWEHLATIAVIPAPRWPSED